MRTKNLFRTLVTACLAVVSVSMFGQLTNARYTQIGAVSDGSFVDTVGLTDPLDLTPVDYIDYVTVGSTMPYAVRKDPNVNFMIAAGLYQNSVFFLNVHNGTAFGATRNETDYRIGDTAAIATAPNLLGAGANILAAQTAFPYTRDTVFAIYWKTKTAANTTTDRKIWTYEWPVSNTAGMTTCLGDSSSLTVRIVDKPIVDWTDNWSAANGPWVLSACGGNNNIIQVNYRGFGDVRVAYDSAMYNLNGSLIAGTSGRDSTQFTNVFGPALPTTITAAQLTNWDPTPAQIGYVEYTIAYVNDQVSRKSLKRTTGAIYRSVAGGTTTGTTTGTDPDFSNATGTQNTEAGVNMPIHKYRVYNMPTPSSRPIKHITNAGW